ncbi:MAG: LLM class flavin-dependent oxidoreductase [Deltaproteobacteria bacterium]|nr:LLM class flavin-dependent oxidoreductase [Deltaproteobacteria bacterium]
MKFMYFFYPALPATIEERKRLRPIARHSEYWQKMFAEIAELSRIAEDAGFEAVAFPEHHLHTEGGEMGSLPLLTQYVISQTSRVKVGPIGIGWKQCLHFFGFTEAFRSPEDDMKYPNKQLLPPSECTMERLERADFALVGTTSDIRRKMDQLVENASPEWFIWQSDQGYVPLEYVKKVLIRFGKQILPHYV